MSEENYIFEKSVEFFPYGIEGAMKRNDGRILLGDNTSGGAVMLPPIGF